MEKADNSNIVIYVERSQLNTLMSNDIVLNSKELMAVYDENRLIGHKIGNGESKWSELDYVDLNMIDEFKVYDQKKGYICKIVLNPVDKIAEN